MGPQEEDQEEDPPEDRAERTCRSMPGHGSECTNAQQMGKLVDNAPFRSWKCHLVHRSPSKTIIVGPIRVPPAQTNTHQTQSSGALYIARHRRLFVWNKPLIAVPWVHSKSVAHAFWAALNAFGRVRPVPRVGHLLAFRRDSPPPPPPQVEVGRRPLGGGGGFWGGGASRRGGLLYLPGYLKIKIGYLTPAFLGARKWAEMLPNP